MFPTRSGEACTNEELMAGDKLKAGQRPEAQAALQREMRLGLDALTSTLSASFDKEVSSRCDLAGVGGGGALCSTSGGGTDVSRQTPVREVQVHWGTGRVLRGYRRRALGKAPTSHNVRPWSRPGGPAWPHQEPPPTQLSPWGDYRKGEAWVDEGPSGTSLKCLTLVS